MKLDRFRQLRDAVDGQATADEVVRRTFADVANAPDYDTMGEAQVEEVARATDRPILLYNIPQRTGVDMPNDLPMLR